ncbi:hypothetical protein [uncultured Gammaproteobacteria bacterium]|nr:hypothetical protein [uncultured Gammaproteobacteria bacterium]
MREKMQSILKKTFITHSHTLEGCFNKSVIFYLKTIVLLRINVLISIFM